MPLGYSPHFVGYLAFIESLNKLARFDTNIVIKHYQRTRRVIANIVEYLHFYGSFAFVSFEKFAKFSYGVGINLG